MLMMHCNLHLTFCTEFQYVQNTWTVSDIGISLVNSSLPLSPLIQEVRWMLMVLSKNQSWEELLSE